MKNLKKCVFKLDKEGRPWGHFEMFMNSDLAYRMLDLCRRANYNLVKVCRGNKIFELHLDKHNNYVYREYEKN